MKNNKTKKVYRKKDYDSDSGMLTTVWGPSMWHFLHTMSFNYPVKPTTNDKRRYKEFMKSLVYILPCKYCRINLKKNYKCLPINNKVMKNRNTFSKYVYNLHEHINKMLGKKSGLKYNDVRERYEHFRSRCTKKEIKKRVMNNKTKKEKGCTEPLVGEKSKCVIKIVPQRYKCKTFQMNKTCKKYRK